MRGTSFLPLVLVCFAAACGGDAGTGDPPETIRAGTAASTDFGSEFDCLTLTLAGDELEFAFLASAAVVSQGNLERFEPAEDVQAVIERAPDEIRSDFGVLVDAYRAYDGVLRRAAGEKGPAPSVEGLLAEAKASFDQVKLSAALERLAAWAEEHCQQAGG